ncbi:hypothetical protein HOY80DRAFT_955003 [Tuber brumale]|nr:hypothetical protein HOY80DRAFT_955003 [Tuber brumale]
MRQPPTKQRPTIATGNHPTHSKIIIIIMFRALSQRVFESKSVQQNNHPLYAPLFRAIGATQERNTGGYKSHLHNGRTAHYADGPSPSTAGFQSSSPSPFVTWERFGQLERTNAMMSSKLDHLDTGQRVMKAEIKDLGSKMDKRCDKREGTIEGKMDKRYDKMEGKVDKRYDMMDKRNDVMDMRYDALGHKMDKKYSELGGQDG